MPTGFNKIFVCALPLLMLINVRAQQVISLWPNGAPGFENRKNEPEEAKDYWVKNVHNPTLTVYRPDSVKATGAAVIVCPGGGHRLLVYTAEGVEPAKYLNSLGVTVFVLKYRLAREEGSPYTIFKTAEQDGKRAMRLVRSRAKEFGIDPARIGIMGFSAGGEVATSVSYSREYTDKNARDEIDRVSSRPDFEILIYPGPGTVPDTVANDAPPAFMLAANNDECCSDPVVRLISAHRKAKVPIEVHLYAQGSHAFNMGNRSKLNSIHTWPQRLADWLRDNNWLEPGKFSKE